MADIPGIIGGASEGKGLGIEFLRHIERTRFLLFVLDLSNFRDIKEQFKVLRLEVGKFSQKLENRPFGIMLSKSDVIEDTENLIKSFVNDLNFNLKKYAQIPHCFLQKEVNDFNAELDFTKPLFTLAVSSVKGDNIESLKHLLYKNLKELKG